MPVYNGYHADLLKDLDESKEVSLMILESFVVLQTCLSCLSSAKERHLGLNSQYCPLKLSEVVWTIDNPEQGQVMELDVQSLLVKKAIECIPPQEREAGLYSQHFIFRRRKAL